jgi:hypothetical protein
VAAALRRAAFRVVTTQLVKAEMSVATPKSQSREPIDVDCIVVCRPGGAIPTDNGSVDVGQSLKRAGELVARFNRSGTTLSRGDIRAILMGEYLRRATAPVDLRAEESCPFEQHIEELFGGQRPKQPRREKQRVLF